MMRKHMGYSDLQCWKRIGEQIRECREARDMTQTRLSELVNVSDDTISRLERGTGCEVSFLLMCKIGKELRVPLEQLCPDNWRLKRSKKIDPMKAKENAEMIYSTIKKMEGLVTREE